MQVMNYSWHWCNNNHIVTPVAIYLIPVAFLSPDVFIPSENILPEFMCWHEIFHLPEKITGDHTKFLTPLT